MWSGVVDAIAGDDSTDADVIDGPGAGACDGYDQATVGDVTVQYHLVWQGLRCQVDSSHVRTGNATVQCHVCDVRVQRHMAWTGMVWYS